MVLERFRFCCQRRTKLALSFVSSFFATSTTSYGQRKALDCFCPSFRGINDKNIKARRMMMSTTSSICPCCFGEGLVMKKKGERATATSRPLETQLSILSDRSRPHHAIRPCNVCQGTGIAAVGATHPREHDQTATITKHNDTKNADDSSFHVSIVGGGIGGCALALALCQRNISCTLYERDWSSNVRPQGYGLTIQQGFKALQSLGLIHPQEQQKKSSIGIKGAAHVVYRSDGTLQSTWGAHSRRTTLSSTTTEDTNKNASNIGTDKKPKRFNVLIPRKDLRQLILDQIPTRVIKWGHELVQYSDKVDSEKIELTFSSSSTADGKSNNNNTVETTTTTTNVLVGADGIWSRVRQCMYGKNDGEEDPSPLRYLQCMVILGIAPTPLSQPNHPLKLDDERNPIIFETMDGETRLYGMPHRHGETMWQLSFPVACESMAKNLSALGADAMKQEAMHRCRRWHQPIDSLLMSTPIECVTGYPLYDRPVPKPIKNAFRKNRPTSHVTLIGDAAHPMAAFKAQGANQALLDAVMLARVLHRTKILMSASTSSTCQRINDNDNNFNNNVDHTANFIPRALAWFEDEMIERVQSKVIASADASQYLHTKLAIAQDNVTRSDTFKRLSRDKH